MAALSTQSKLRLQSNVYLLCCKRTYSSQTQSRKASISSDVTSTSQHFASSNTPVLSSTTSPPMPKLPPLSILPLSTIVRSLATSSVSSSPLLLPPSLKLMGILAHTKSTFLSPDHNPILKFFVKHTFYKQFCAGENAQEVQRTIDSLKSLGYRGVILGYAREVVMDESQTAKLASSGNGEAAEACIRDEIIPWAKGTRETVELANPEDFVALKFTGAGSQALYNLSKNEQPSPALEKAIDSICDLAEKRGVRLLFDAEQQAVQAGIDAWTMQYMKKYNKKDRAVVYGTYQAYLKATPSILAGHMADAQKNGFSIGVKLVRGAYLGSDPRHLIHDTKEDTDACYNGIAESLARREYNSILKPAEPNTPFPSVNVVLAGHNHESVRKVQSLRTKQAQSGENQTDMVYAQLQGMADEVSTELVMSGKTGADAKNVDVPKAYKYLVWGTTGECMKYLLRRAQENKDAVQRTREGRNAMAGELWRRCKSAFGVTA